MRYLALFADQGCLAVFLVDVYSNVYGHPDSSPPFFSWLA
jgi:hypothetical protein